MASTEDMAKISISSSVASLEPSVTLAITAKAKELKAQGIDVVSLSAGEPDFDTPEPIKAAAQAALAQGVTKYTPAVGTLELRQAISDKFKRDQNLSIPTERIIVSSGAKHSIFNALFALLNPGDDVLIPAPYWLSYPQMTTLLRANSQVIPTDESTQFKLTSDLLRKAITPKSKVLILNSPSNPTGAVYTREELEDLVTVLKANPQIAIISDEIYEKLIFDNRTHYSIASLDSEIASRTIVVNGHSKAYAMTGWRLGYAGYPNKEWAKAVSSLQSHSTSNPTSFAQAGGVVALEQGDAEARKMCHIYQKRRDFFVERISAIPQLTPFVPQGAFYCFVNTSRTGLDSVALAKALLEEIHVAVVPGRPFGSDDHVRMSFATSEKDLEEATRRLSAWFKKR